MTDYEKVNKPELLKLCEERGLETEGCTAKQMRSLLVMNDNKDVSICDGCHYYQEDVVLQEWGHKSFGGMRGNWCRQYKCHLPIAPKACDGFLDIETANDPNLSRTVDARVRSEKRTTN